MREPLLGSRISQVPDSIRRLRLRGGDDDGAIVGCCGCCSAFVIFIAMFCISSLGPNTYGLMRNTITSTVTMETHRGGIYFTGPFMGFIMFPATAVTIEFSKAYEADGPPVRTRTGADPQDPDSGGQPISISAAFQYFFQGETLHDVYTSFGGQPQAQARYLLLARNVISNTAQRFTPQDFWTDRRAISNVMVEALNRTLSKNGYVEVKYFEIMRIDFATQFEDSITAVQVAEQQKVVNEYLQEVAQVQQSIEVLKSKVKAHIANISAGAEATGKEIRAKASKEAFHLKQATKARKYKELRDRLKFTPEQMTTYFKIKSLQMQRASGSAGSKMVVGVPNPTSTAATGPAAPADSSARRLNEL